MIHSFQNSPFIWYVDTSKKKNSHILILHLQRVCVDHHESKARSFKEKKYSDKGIKTDKKNKGFSSTSSANGGNAQGASSVRESITSKSYVTKMKVLKKRLVQTHDSDSESGEDFVTFLESGGWSSDVV